jgi:hypothetical protein
MACIITLSLNGPSADRQTDSSGTAPQKNNVGLIYFDLAGFLGVSVARASGCEPCTLEFLQRIPGLIPFPQKKMIGLTSLD